MIAAGSLFTSCVENTEPAGIKDLREAKADYLAALSNLRAADAEKVKAEATLVQAQAATEQARAALVQAAAKAKEIANDKTAADNAIALEKARKDAEVYLAQQEKVLAKAEEDLRAYLVKVEEQSKQLTWEEQRIVSAYTAAYNKVVAKEADVRSKEKALYEATYNTEKGGVNNVEAAKARYEATVADETEKIAKWQAKQEEYTAKSEEEIAKYDVWAAEYKKLKDSIEAYEYDKADIWKAAEIAKIENKDAMAAFYGTLADAQDDVQAVINAAEDFSMVYTRAAKNAFELPNPKVSFFATFENAVNGITNEIGNNIKVKDGENDTKVLSVNFNDKKKAYNAIFGDEEDETKASLAGIIDALKRDSVVVDQFVKDTAGIGALVAETLADYNATKDTLVDGIGAYKPYVDANAAYTATRTEANAKAKVASDAIDYLLKAIKGAQKQQEGTGKWALSRGMKDSIETAIIDYGKAVNDYFGNVKRDSVVTYVFDKSGAEVEKKIALKDLTKENFEPYKVTGTENWRTDFIKASDAAGVIPDADVARFYSYNIVLDTVTNVCSLPGKIVVKWYEGNTDDEVYQYKNVTVKDWGIETRPKKATDAKLYHYVAAEKTFKSGSEEFNYGGLVEKGNDVTTAYNNFYTNIYEHFWGVKFNSSADSLVINFTEKTYTDPYTIPDFTHEAGFFTKSKKGAGSIDWAKVGLKSNKELDVISKQLKQTSNGQEINNIEVKEDNNRVNWTLYAKVLATKQFEDEAKYYVENTKALAEIEEVVAGVELAYAAAVLEEVVNKAAADSAVTAYLGEDIVEAALEGKEEGTTATSLWETDLVVNCTTKNIDEFIVKETGEYNLGGQQLAAAEEYIPEYAESEATIWATIDAIEDAQDECGELAEIIEDYAKRIANLDEYRIKHGSDPEDVAEQVAEAWERVLGFVAGKISHHESEKAQAEGSIKKLEAGYDQTQINIENAKDDLAKAQQALEQAEVEFAVAEAAYKAVLANHDITE